MARLSSTLFLLFNLMALASGCFGVGSYLYFQIHRVTDCQNVVQKPLMVMGIILIVMSFLGLVGAIFKLTCLLWIYSVVALLVLAGLTAFALFVYTVEDTSGSGGLAGLGFKKHNAGGDYTQWLQNMVIDGKHWNGIRTCLIDHEICKRLENTVQNSQDFYLKKLSPVQSGCCRPPIYCGFEYKNATFWVTPKSGKVSNERDCNLWSNKQEKLCYNCNTCKAAVIKKSRNTWKIFAILDSIDIAILLIAYALSCCTRNHIVSDTKYNRVHP
ncbi:tetraspanin-8 [Manihot esculenta]|uniref:Uncharacterized protein n=1 Tax=Manihot esculenta TaxID=3983 RepID=A0ACB7I971_MANES|nr:tetraspanin-8 [Manihot esculenta]KAG8661609.1 hypothetical protein MANES_01G023100v8 [Manihot esculenta]